MKAAGRDSAGSTPIVRLDGYEGPIDFLLELARAQKVDLGRLSIAALVDQYVAAMEAPGARATLAERGDWLIAASWLVLLKSKLLVRAGDEPEVPEAERLREGLIRADQRRQARELTGWLERRPQLGQEVFARGATEAVPALGSEERGDLLDLLLACFDLMDVPARPTRETGKPFVPPVSDVWTLTEALAHLRMWLRHHPEGGELGGLMTGITGFASASLLRQRSSLASGFMAGLELAKQGEALLWQDQASGLLQVAPPPRTPSP